MRHAGRVPVPFVDLGGVFSAGGFFPGRRFATMVKWSRGGAAVDGAVRADVKPCSARLAHGFRSCLHDMRCTAAIDVLVMILVRAPQDVELTCRAHRSRASTRVCDAIMTVA